MTRPFRVLVACRGNQCRSPFAERLLRHRLQASGVDPSVVAVTSAGIRSVAGRELDGSTADQLRTRGLPSDGHVSRSVDAALLGQSDLVLTASQAQRDEIIRMDAAARQRTFTLAEFADVAQSVDLAAAAEEPDAVGRLRRVVQDADRLRAGRPEETREDDVPAPFGRSQDTHARVAATIEGFVDRFAPLVAAAAIGTVPAPRSRRSSRVGAVVALLALVAAVGAAGVVGAQALSARNELSAAQPVVARARTAALEGDVATARRELSTLRAHTQAARRDTDGPLWSLAAHLPWVGDDVRAVRTISAELDAVATDVLPPLLDAGDMLGSQAQLREGNGIDLEPLAAAAPVLNRADAQAQVVAAEISAIPTAGLLSPVRTAVAGVTAATDALRSLVGTTADTARILPPLLGAEGPRRYLVSFQNPAESRGTGGLIGAYAVLEADGGDVEVLRLGPNGDLKHLDALPFEPGPGFRELYGEAPALWSNANVSPHFPYGARLMLAAWEEQFDERLDGVLATDPVALGYLLGATGPVTLPNGDVITADNAAETTMSTAYARFPDSVERDGYLQEVGAAVFATAFSGGGDAAALSEALARAITEHRLVAYSTDEDLQADIAPTALAGTLPSGDAPFLGLVVNQLQPNKIDYYLDREVTYALGECEDHGMRRSDAKIVLTNTAPETGLPAYVSGAPRPEGLSRLFVTVHATTGAILDTARLDGERVFVRQAEELGRPVFVFGVDIPPGQSRTLTLQLVEPVREGAPTVWEQPLARPQTSVVHDGACGG